MAVRPPAAHATMVGPHRRRREERDERPCVNRAHLDLVRGGEQRGVVVGRLPRAARPIDAFVACALEVRTALTTPRGDETDDRVDRLGPEPLRDERVGVLAQPGVEVGEPGDRRGPHRDPHRAQHSPDRLGNAPHERVLEHQDLEGEPDPVRVRGMAGRVEQRRSLCRVELGGGLDRRVVPLRVRGYRAVGGPAVAAEVARDERLAVDR
jgi:hypothetical protein